MVSLLPRGTLLEVRVSSDSNLTLRLLREQREDMKTFREEVRQFRAEVKSRFDHVETRLATVEHTLSGMSAHLFAVTGMVKDHERRIRKLEGRSSK